MQTGTRHFLLSCSEVKSTGYSEFDEPISVRLQRYPLLQYMLITILCQRTATNGIASFCIDHRWRQMAFFRVFQNGKGPTFVRLTWNKAALVCTKFNSLLYNTNRFHAAVHLSSRSQRICPVINHRGRQDVVRTSVTHSAIAPCATFLSLPHFNVICELLLGRCKVTWNLFVKYAWNFKNQVRT